MYPLRKENWCPYAIIFSAAGVNILIYIVREKSERKHNEGGNKLQGRYPLNICILGGGNVGTLLAADLGRQECVSVRVFTSRPNEWSRVVRVFDSNDTFLYQGYVDIVSDDPRQAVTDADIIISTLPAHVARDSIKTVSPFIKEGAWLGMMPGSGGREYFCKDLIEAGVVFFGFQRVHGISRIKKYGSEVYSLGKKQELFVSAIPAAKAYEVCDLLEALLLIKCTMAPNYLNVTLTPSNPILHTTRLYSLFQNWRPGVIYEKEIRFYDEWTNECSRILLACDDELQALCRTLEGLDLQMVRSLREHYESETPEELTNKIRSISAFRNIKAPMKKIEGGFIPDLESRYFLEDFPYGLCVIKSFCVIAGVETPNIDKVLRWFGKVMGVKYYANGTFSGPDLKDLPLPNNYGVTTVNDIISFYR